jgi:hypothetical protein
MCVYYVGVYSFEEYINTYMQLRPKTLFMVCGTWSAGFRGVMNSIWLLLLHRNGPRD